MTHSSGPWAHPPRPRSHSRFRRAMRNIGWAVLCVVGAYLLMLGAQAWDFYVNGWSW